MSNCFFLEIVPIDNEASCLLRQVPALGEEFALGSPETANHLVEALAQYEIVMLRGHDSFAIGHMRDEAFHCSSTLEESCQIAIATKTLNEPLMAYRGMSREYAKWQRQPESR